MRIGTTIIGAALCLLAAGVAARQLDAEGPGATAAPAVPSAQPSSGRAPARSPSATILSKQPDGHFWAEARVDDTRVRFLVDTGASVVALTVRDALAAGYDPRNLVFDRPVSTAGGQVLAAAVTLERLSIGGIVEEDVPAMVLAEGLEHSLLGMSWLGRLSRIEATPDALILRR